MSDKEYGDLMSGRVDALVKNSVFDKATGHVTFDTSKVELPEGVSTDSIKTHVGFINDLSAQTEVAVAQIAREQHKLNDKLTTVDGTLDFDGFLINSQHHLMTKVGDEQLFGQGISAVSYQHSDEQALWLETQRIANVEQAKKLFG